MKKLMIGAVCAIMVAATFAEPSVEITEAYQEVPGSGVVNYTYTISGLKGVTDLYIKVGAKGCDKTETITVESVAEGTVTTSVDVKKLLGKAYPNVTLFAELELEDGVQLWANGPYFAKANIGATKPEEEGYYFWWGDTVGYKQDGGKWVSVKDGSAFTFAKENCSTFSWTLVGLYNNGYIDANSASGKLNPKYDAAAVHLGGSWRMPTINELKALINNCTMAWKTNWNGTGVKGCLVTGKGAYSSKSIFLPAVSDGSLGVHWSATPNDNDTEPGLSKNLVVGPDNNFENKSGRWQGFPVRPVR